MYIFVLKKGRVVVTTPDGFMEVGCQRATKVDMSPTCFLKTLWGCKWLLCLKLTSNWCDIFQHMMGNDELKYSKKKKKNRSSVVKPPPIYVYNCWWHMYFWCMVWMSVYGLWAVGTVRCCGKGPPYYPSSLLLCSLPHSFFLRTI